MSLETSPGHDGIFAMVGVNIDVEMSPALWTLDIHRLLLVDYRL